MIAVNLRRFYPFGKRTEGSVMRGRTVQRKCINESVIVSGCVTSNDINPVRKGR